MREFKLPSLGADMDAGTLLGVLSFHDVAKAVYEEQSFENRMLKSYIKNWPDEEETTAQPLS